MEVGTGVISALVLPVPIEVGTTVCCSTAKDEAAEGNCVDCVRVGRLFRFVGWSDGRRVGCGLCGLRGFADGTEVGNLVVVDGVKVGATVSIFVGMFVAATVQTILGLPVDTV